MGQFGAKYLVKGLRLSPTSIHRWVGEWFYYNYAAGSFHTKKLCSRLYSTELEFYSQDNKFAFWATLWGVMNNVRTCSIVRWKARGRLPLLYNWIFFFGSYGSDVISRYRSKSAFLKMGWVNLSTNFRWKRTSPTNLFLCQKTRFITLSCDVKILFVTKHACDRWTDGRTKLRSPRPR